jgi:hypothetical protein
MVPFSYFQGLINSRVMKKYSLPVEMWTLGFLDISEAWHLPSGAFAHSCLPAFLILILAPNFREFKVF